MRTVQHDSPSRRWPWFTLACVMALADQLVKEIVHAQMSFGQVIPLTPFFNWVYTGNTGAAFSFLAEAGGWGSCSRNGTVSLDWHLVYAPKRVARYVIAHELSHLQTMNHSEDFWRTVRRVYGDYEKEHGWLKENEHLLGYSRVDVRA